MTRHLIAKSTGPAVLWISNFVALIFLVATQASACSPDGKEGFLPKNHLKVKVGALDASGLDQKAFDATIDKVLSIYTPVVAERGGNLKVERLWDDATVNAYADRKGKVWALHMFGGLARYQGMTEDSFALVVCHELGHQIGGAPKTGFLFFRSWAANEGEADYFATLKCLRNVFAKDPNPPVSVAPALVTEMCQKSFNSPAEITICERSTVAGMALGKVLSAISPTPDPKGPQVETPDVSEVSSTVNGHPPAQCRLDTYFQGAVCTAPVSTDLNEKNPVVGACAEEQGAQVGFRPRCWYKPKIRTL